MSVFRVIVSFCSEFTYLLADCALIFAPLCLSRSVQCFPIMLVLSAFSFFQQTQFIRAISRICQQHKCMSMCGGEKSELCVYILSCYLNEMTSHFCRRPSSSVPPHFHSKHSTPTNYLPWIDFSFPLLLSIPHPANKTRMEERKSASCQRCNYLKIN